MAGLRIVAPGPKTMAVQTRLIHGSRAMHEGLRGVGNDVSPSIHVSIATEPGTNVLANAFAHVNDSARNRMVKPEKGPIYVRLGLNNHLQLEHAGVVLEGLVPEQTDYEGVAFAAGMGAIDAAIETQVHAGEGVIFFMPVYGCTNRLAFRLQNYDGRKVFFADPRDIDSVVSLIKANPEMKLLSGEFQANPTLSLLDVGKMAQVVEDANKQGWTNQPLQLGVDNTFITPLGFRALEHGAKWVLNSGSKYFGGFMQTCSGLLVAPQEMVYGDPGKDNGLLSYRDQKGSVLSAISAHQIYTTGLSTLFMRARWMEAVAEQVAEFLVDNEYVDRTIYAGLPNYPDREIAYVYLKDYDGIPYHGSMIYFEVKGNTPEETKERGFRLMTYLEKKGYATTVAVSLGAVYTLVEHPASMTHASYSPDQLKAAGISPGGIRIAVGTESPDDIIADLQEGLAFAYSDKPIESLDN